jgi:hypothetical protein
MATAVQIIKFTIIVLLLILLLPVILLWIIIKYWIFKFTLRSNLKASGMPKKQARLLTKEMSIKNIFDFND